MVPPVAVQVTAELADAVNCCCAPGVNVAELGETVTGLLLDTLIVSLAENTCCGLALSQALQVKWCDPGAMLSIVSILDAFTEYTAVLLKSK